MPARVSDRWERASKDVSKPPLLIYFTSALQFVEFQSRLFLIKSMHHQGKTLTFAAGLFSDCNLYLLEGLKDRLFEVSIIK